MEFDKYEMDFEIENFMKKQKKIDIIQLFVFVFCFGALVSCGNVGTANFNLVANVTSKSEVSPRLDKSLIFAGLSSVSNITDTTATLNWLAHVDAVSYAIFNVISGKAVYMQTVNGQSSSSFTLTGLSPNTNYKFRVKMLNSSGVYDGNIKDIEVTMNLVPSSPSAISLVTPAYSPALNGTPKLRVSGVKNGDVIKLFTDSSCSTQVASGTASGASIELTTSNLPAGPYSFYATATNPLGSVSDCSSATVAYLRNQCPDGYIPVPFNSDVGTTADFCVAKYEMKNVGGVATSQAIGTPWVIVTQAASITACSNLNATNKVINKYYLISNPEWMTIARNVENVGSNWTSGIAGSGVLARGWTNGSNAGVAPSTGPSCLYNNGANTCASTGTTDNRRTLTLSNGEEIWDFSGNAWEWVNWKVTPANKAYIAANPIGTDQGWKEFRDLNTNIGASDEMRPSTWQSSFLSAIGTEGLGRYYAGVNTSGGAALRGGDWNSGENAGVYTLHLLYSSSIAHTFFGFRCVYRP